VIYNGTDTSTFSFTTTGAPASMTLTPASSTVAVGGVQPVTVKILDSAGNETQPGTSDSVKVEATSPGSPTSTTLTAANISSSLTDGSASVNISMASAGTSTVTATPLGFLPSYGVTTQSATVTASGTIQSTPVAGMEVSSPANAINDLGTALTHKSQVPAGTTSLKIAIDDDTGSTSTAGATLLFQVNTSAGSVNGVSGADLPAIISATVAADETAELDLTLGAGAQVAGEYVTITQVKADATTAVFPGTTLTVTQKTPTVIAADVTISPSGTMVAKLGDPVSVAVSVDDSFGTPQSGWTVAAYRTSSSSASNFLSSGVTDSSGVTTVTVNNASTAVDGTTESYVFLVSNNLGTSFDKTGLSVKWTTTGGLTALSVASTGTTCSNTSCDQTTVAAVAAPTDGVVDAGSATTAYVTVDTGATTNTPADWADFQITTTPTNAATVTTPEGVYVSATAPSTTAIKWNAGKNSAVIDGGAPGNAYIWGTKTGYHDVTVTSGGLTVVVKVYVQNAGTDAYNIGLSPVSQTIAQGAFGTVTLSVTDVFGNPVKTDGTTSAAVKVSASGQVLLAGSNTSEVVSTDADGVAKLTVLGAASAGEGTISAAPNAAVGARAAAWEPTFTPPSGASVPVTSAAAAVTVSGSSTQSIAIVGTRTTVKGKPGIVVDGLTTGFDEGAAMVPHIKFPGQTSYSEGSARPKVDADSEFFWQRKTGKKIYIYFTDELTGLIKSDRIIIQAK
jgi:hypothetical protein